MHNPELDLWFEREVPVRADEVWRAWTESELLVQWFTPAPWRTLSATYEPRPGGRVHTVMGSPEGETFDSEGCVLEAVAGERLVWTGALGPGFRPKPADQVGLSFTARIELTPTETGCVYRASALHADAASCAQHAAMGFVEGWGKALDQLVELMLSLR